MADTVPAPSRNMLTARSTACWWAWWRKVVLSDAREPRPRFGGSFTADPVRPRSVSPSRHDVDPDDARRLTRLMYESPKKSDGDVENP
ncbi:hypothetical protein [Streptomyces sp900116325]|uniref:hypothetical protein n=1 Tax=Streptomyces sp. 900116325 TaxID=3154295 RepID=UPI0033F58E19